MGARWLHAQHKKPVTPTGGWLFSVFHSYIISKTLSYKRVVIRIDVVERVGVLVDFIIMFHEVRCCLTDAQHH